MVSIHRVSVDVLLIISVVCFIFRFKCGADFRLSNERLWNAQLKINDYKTPHLDSMGCMHKNVHSLIAIQDMSAVVILLVVKFSRFLVKDKSENTFIKYVMLWV